MIAEGSELLLLTKQAPFIGSIVLPILGAVPDGAIVLFSGMGPDAPQQIAVGVGALAGSTIMLLTLPWCVSIQYGSVDCENITDKDIYTQPLSGSKNKIRGFASLTGTGVKIDKSIKQLGLVMLLTLISYVVVQSVSFTNIKYGPSHDTILIPAIISLVFSVLLFIQ